MIGKLRHYVDIQTPTPVEGDRGYSLTWDDLYSQVPAEIMTLAGRELEFARQVVATATHRIRIRYHAGLTTKDRITLGARTFNINYIDTQDQRHFWQTILATEEV